MLIMVVDYLSGPLIQFPILYVLPIGLAAWYSGPWWGGALAILLPLGRVLFAIVGHTQWTTRTNLAANTVIRILAFALLVFLINQIIRKSRDIQERIKIEKKLAAQQKHLRNLSADLAVAEETERRRIAAGLHDDVNQMLVAAKLRLAALTAATDPNTIRAESAKVEEALDSVLASSRSLIFDLVSPVLQKLGLAAALEDLCERMERQHGISFTFRTEGDIGVLSNDTEIILFHAVSELARNTVKHAEAQNVKVLLVRHTKELKLTVEDDGRGFEKVPNLEDMSPAGGFGLFTINERMQYLDGSIKIEPVAPRGSRVELTVPLRAEEMD